MTAPRLTVVGDPDDPRLAPYRAVRERDLVGREGLFVAEGEVVLRTLAASAAHAVVSVLLADQGRVERLRPVLEALPEAVPIFISAPAVMDAVAGFPMHRGVLAIGRRAGPLSAEALLDALPDEALVVGLIGLSNHDNVGGAFRNAAAFGADAVLLDETSCDPLYRKAIRVSSGAVLRVPWARAGDGETMAALLAKRGFEVLALSPSGERPLSQHPRRRRVAPLFGAEGPGLSPAVMARCATVAIPMAKDVDSLNVATTAGVVLHHLAHVARRIG